MSSKAHAALLLTPGASAGRDQSQLVAIDAAVSELGVVVERIDFPYKREGRRAPDKPAVLIDAVRRGATELAERAGVPGERVILGGRSMGGRMCSMAVAEGLPALGLVLVSYPLHPPGKADKLRTEHFPDITVPVLFVSGTRDAFGTATELEAASATIRGRVSHVWVEGGDHSLRRKDEVIAQIVAERARDWL